MIQMENGTNKGKRFRRTIEDFICLNCGLNATGNGYTDHCPKCLFGRHVDVMPGDRSEQCHGLMKPMHSVYKGGRTGIGKGRALQALWEAWYFFS